MAKTGDALAALLCIDRLEVGPVTIEPDRIATQVTVTRGKSSAQIELAFKYDTPFLDPGDPVLANLASMMVAQPALNYGLFCKELVFRGPLDRADRRFLEEMARNTAREIWVNKLLLDNPFIDPALRGKLDPRPADFLLSKLSFPDAPKSDQRPAAVDERARRRVAVLSSGGKDSLLTYGLLRECDVEVHPVFVNESGRHWYTALNAHRHFRDNVENTTRVWTNIDRFYNQMLRHLPFVRQDFARVRADQYPIRLWTVAGLVFSALPILHHRKIGRLAVGDEYDSTLRASYRGIPHYAGLYDQSRFFDNALSRYYTSKRWGYAQFSILRPLSELLIQKVLVERYPDLQRHQVSCHAAHIVDDRALPCGKCEKCRRIVGMLSCLGADPTRCGYTPEQVRSVLDSLTPDSLHQEAAGAEHMFHLLVERGLVQASGKGLARKRPHPEVLKLRFDAERSPFDTFPNDLRAPVYAIVREHAEGSVRRSGRVWVDVDPLGPASLDPPYRFESAAKSGQAKASGEGFLLAELTWPEARARLREVDIALLPVGAIEQHGPHLPLDVDAHDADLLCREVAAACSAPRPVVLPLLPYGVSYHHEDFPGTISISPNTLSQLVYEIGMNVARQGITKLIIVNGHGGNGPALHFAAQLINRDAHIFTCVDSGESSDAEVDAVSDTRNDVHAGEIETSTTLARRPHLVKMQLARPSVPSFSSEYLDFSSKKGVGWYVRTARISRDGVLGDPTRASEEKGQRIWQIWTRNLVQLVEDLKGMTLDEIHERRY